MGLWNSVREPGFKCNMYSYKLVDCSTSSIELPASRLFTPNLLFYHILVYICMIITTKNKNFCSTIACRARGYHGTRTLTQSQSCSTIYQSTMASHFTIRKRAIPSHMHHLIRFTFHTYRTLPVL